MTIPGFTAQASLDQAASAYRGALYKIPLGGVRPAHFIDLWWTCINWERYCVYYDSISDRCLLWWWRCA